MSKVTVKRIKEYFNVEHVEQIDSKQLFVFKYKGHFVLCSYLTIVAVKGIGQWFITKEKYSRTTSKQLTQFFNSYYKSYEKVYIEDIELEQLINKQD